MIHITAIALIVLWAGPGWAQGLQFSVENKAYLVGETSSRSVGQVLIVEGDPAVLLADSEVRLVLPADTPLSWTEDTGSLVLGGGADGKIASNGFADDKTLVLTVGPEDFSAGEVLTIDGLFVDNFVDPAAPVALELFIGTAETAILSAGTWRIGIPVLVTKAQAYIVGETSPQSVGQVRIEAGDPAVLLGGSEVRLVLPADTPLTWTEDAGSLVLGGGAEGKITSRVFADDKTLVLMVGVGDFAADEVLTIDGLAVENFAESSAPVALRLFVGSSEVVVVSESTWRIGNPALVMEDRAYLVGEPGPQLVGQVRIEVGDPAVLLAGSQVRLQFPINSPLIWFDNAGSLTLGGGREGKIASRDFVDDKTLVLMVGAEDFVAGEVLTIDGLTVDSFDELMEPDALELFVRASVAPVLSDGTLSIGDPSIVVEDQAYIVGEATSRSVGQVRIEESRPAALIAGSQVRLLLSDDTPLTWIDDAGALVLGGDAEGKITDRDFADDKTLVLTVGAEDFAAGEMLTIDGLAVDNFTDPSAPVSLQMLVGTSEVVVVSEGTWRIGNPALWAQDWVFVVSEVATQAADQVRIEESSPAALIAGSQVRLVLPADTPLTWVGDESVLVLGGNAVNKIASSTFADAKTLVLTVGSADFASGEVLTIDGLFVDDFADPAAPVPLELFVGASETPVLSAGTWRVSNPALVMEDQAYIIGEAISRSTGQVRLEEGGVAALLAGSQVRLVIPDDTPLAWVDNAGSLALSGGAEGKISNRTFVDPKTLVLTVGMVDFAAGEVLTIDGLEVENPIAVSASVPLQMFVGGGLTPVLSGGTLRVGDPVLSVASTILVTSDGVAELGIITIRENPIAAGLTTNHQIRLVLPADLNVEWDTAATGLVVLGGAQVGNVDRDVIYPLNGNGKTAVLTILGNFSPGEELTIAGLRLTNFGESSSGKLGLSIGEGEPVIRTADMDLRLGNPFLSIANKGFVSGDLSAALGSVIIQEEAVAGLVAGRRIRLVLPDALDMVWDTTVEDLVPAGGQAGNVDMLVTYPDPADNERTVELEVIGDFFADEALILDQLRVTNIGNISPPAALELHVDNRPDDGEFHFHAASDGLLRIGQPVLELGQSHVFVVNDPVQNLSPVRIRADTVASGISSGRVLRLVLPQNLNMEWDADGAPTLEGSLADSIELLGIEGREVRLRASGDFIAGGELVVSGLRLTNFSAGSVQTSLALRLDEEAADRAESDSTLAVAEPSFATDFGPGDAAEGQGFVVGDGKAVFASVNIEADPQLSGVTAADDIRIILPLGLDGLVAVRWDITTPPFAVPTTAADKIDGFVIEDDGQTLLIDLIEDLLPGEVLQISGLVLQVEDVLPRGALGLSLNGTDQINLEDGRWIEVGSPSIVSARDHVFDIDQGAGTLFAVAIREHQEAASITSEFSLLLPAESGLRWGKTPGLGGIPLEELSINDDIQEKISAVVLNPDATELIVTVDVPFEPGDSLVFANLPVRLVGNAGPNVLSLLVTPGVDGELASGVDAVDSASLRVGNPTLAVAPITSVRDTLFVVGDGDRPLPGLSLEEGAVAIGNVLDGITIRLPAGFTGVWKTDAAVELSGSAVEGGKVRDVVPADYDGRILRIEVLEDFAAGETLQINGLSVVAGKEAAVRDSLQLAMLAERHAQKILPVAVGAPTLRSVRSQSFIVFADGHGDVENELAALTVRESAISRSILPEQGILLIIPESLAMEWAEPADMENIELGGSAGLAGKVGIPVLRNAKMLEFPVEKPFEPSDELTVSGLLVRNFVAASSPVGLALSVTDLNSISARDDSTKRIGQPGLSSMNRQRFMVDQAALLDTLTIVEHPDVGSIDSTFSLIIPDGFNAIWSTDLDPVLPGTVSLVGGNDKELIFRVSQPLVGGDSVQISGLEWVVQAPSTDTRLILSVNGGTDGLDTQVKRISGRPTVALAQDWAFVVAESDTVISVIVKDSQIAPAIIAGEELWLVIPDSLSLAWTDNNVEFAGDPQVLAKVDADAVAIRQGGKVLAIGIQEDFAVGDSVEVRAAVGDFAEVSSARSIFLTLLQDIETHSEATARTVRIGQPSIESDEDQVFIAELDDQDGRFFLLGGETLSGPAPSAPLWIREHSLVGVITPDLGIRIALPDTLAISWEVVDSIRVSGSAVAHLPSPVPRTADSTLVFEGDKVVYLPVAEDFSSGDDLRVEGLRFRGFTQPSRRASLQLSVNGRRTPHNALDTRTKRVGRPAVEVGVTQRFDVDEDIVAAAPVLIVEDLEGAITRVSGIKLVLNEELGGNLSLSAGQVAFEGSAADKVGSWSIDNTKGTLDIEVVEDFTGGDSLIVRGLQFKGVNSVAEVSSLFTMSVSANEVDGQTSLGAKIGDLDLDSVNEKVFRVGDLHSSSIDFVFSEAAVPILAAGDVIFLTIPQEVPFTWATSGETVYVLEPRSTPPGALTPKVLDVDPPTGDGISEVTFGTDGKTVLLTLGEAPGSNGRIAISGLTLGNFTKRDSANILFDVTLGDSAQLDEAGRKIQRFTKVDPNFVRVVLPGLSSIETQTFFVTDDGGSVDLLPLVLVEDPFATSVEAGEDLHIYLPADMEAEWDVTRVELDGVAGTKLNPSVDYSSARDAVIFRLDTPLEPGESVEIRGLGLRPRAATPNKQLELSLNGGVTINVVDEEFKRIGNPVLTVQDTMAEGGLRDTMVFISRDVLRADAPANEIIYPVRLATNPTAAALVAGDTLRLTIPDSFAAIWAESQDLLEFLDAEGTGQPKISLIDSVIGGGKVLALKVESDFTASEVVAAKGLQMTGLDQASANTKLTMDIRQRTLRLEISQQIKKVPPQSMRIGAPTIDSAGNQVFVVDDLSTIKLPITVQEDTIAAGIVAERDLHIVIPDDLALEWDTEVRPSFSGAAESKVGNGAEFLTNKVLFIPVDISFSEGDDLVISDLQMRNFSRSSQGHIEMLPLDDLRYVIEDPDTLFVGEPNFFSADFQVFVVDDNPTQLLPITIVEDLVVPTLRADSKIRIQLPAELNATWVDGDITLGLDGTAADKVNPKARVEGNAVIISVTSTFDPGDRLIIRSGLQLRNFAGPSPPSFLTMRVTEGETNPALDSRPKSIGQPRLSSSDSLSLPLDITPEFIDKQQNRDCLDCPVEFRFAIEEDTIAAAIRGETDILLAFVGAMKDYLEWDIGGQPMVLRNRGGVVDTLDQAISLRGETGDTIRVDLVEELLQAGDRIELSGLRLRVEKAIYGELETLPDGPENSLSARLPIEDVVGLTVHGSNDSLFYDGGSIPNTNQARSVDETEVLIELFLPVMFDRPRVFTSSDSDDLTTWIAFYTPPYLMAMAAEDYSVEYFQSFRRSEADTDTLFVGESLEPQLIKNVESIEIDIDSSEGNEEHKLRLWEVRIPLGDRELYQVNRWFDDSSLDSLLDEAPTQLEMRIRNGMGLQVREKGRPVAWGPRDRDVADSHIARLDFRDWVYPDQVRFPLENRYFNTTTVVDSLRLANDLSDMELGRVVLIDSTGLIQKDLDPNSVEPQNDGVRLDSLRLRDSDNRVQLREGVNEFRFYFEGADDLLSFPIIRQFVVDTTVPVMAFADSVDGRLGGVPMDSVAAPEKLDVRRRMVNVFRPIAGEDRSGLGLPVTIADSLRTKLVDNIVIPIDSNAIGRGGMPLSSNVLEIWRDGQKAQDPLHFHMPIKRYPVAFTVYGQTVGGERIDIGSEPDTIDLQEGLINAMAVPTFADLGFAPIQAEHNDNVLELAISLEPDLSLDDDEPSNFIFPLSLLPSPLRENDVNIVVSLSLEDLAGNAVELQLGEPIEFLIKTGDVDGLLVDKTINFPNPFATLPIADAALGTTIRFVITPQLQNIATAKLRIFDAGGEQVFIANFPDLGAGEHLFTWSGYDVYGHPLATGVYFAIIEVTSGTQVEINKLKIAILNR